MEVFGTGEDEEFQSQTNERFTNRNTEIHTDGESPKGCPRPGVQDGR